MQNDGIDREVGVDPRTSTRKGKLMLITFSGLPGTGKSTLASRLAVRLGAVYLRVDSIEQAIRTSGILDEGAEMGGAGYAVCYSVAADNLAIGTTVVADSVNPLEVTRNAFRNIAAHIGVPVFEIEIVCSDRQQHRQRVETRQSTIAGLVLPTWQEVVDRDYNAWDRPHLQIDTAFKSVEQCVDQILRALPVA
ncbi:MULTISPECIES: AAA family ATPase [Burkholderia]|uniref:AAA family ATPase n=1 Tax=Burkholderia TaxID=32008 RepID=UPI001F616075|nr:MULTISPECIES: AAA family ATPase [Burkholderia]MCI3974438.1 AAA family ATPase [Burkholderia sp. HI4860]MDN7789229.1 AAA family ATPase [Burkholderia contaminans]